MTKTHFFYANEYTESVLYYTFTPTAEDSKCETSLCFWLGAEGDCDD